MASLLDRFIQRERRFPSGSEFLRASAQQSGGLLGPMDSPPRRQPPSVLDAQPSGPSGGGVTMPAAAGGGGGLPANQPVQAGPGQAAPQQGSTPRPDGSRKPEPGPGEDGLSFFSRLFLGELDPAERRALSSEDQDRLLRQGLVTAGLQMLGSNAPGTPLGEVIARGILGARQDTAQTAGELLDRRNAQIRLARRAKVMNNPDLTPLEKWTEIRRISAKNGDTAGVKEATKIVENLRELNAGEGEAEFQVVNGQPVFVDKANRRVTDLEGNVVTEIPEEQENAPLEGSFREDVMVNGELHTVLFNRAGQPIRDLGPAEASGGGGGPDPQKVQVARTLDREVQNIRSLLGDDPTTEAVEGADQFGLFDTFGRAARWLPAELQPSKLKQMKAASENILSLIVRQRSGAQATDAEVQRLKSFAIPKPGDDPTTVQTKLQRIENIVSGFKRTGDANAVVDPIMRGNAGAVGAGSGGDVDTVIEEEFGGGS